MKHHNFHEEIEWGERKDLTLVEKIMFWGMVVIVFIALVIIVFEFIV